ncbi:MAG: hypothetical protein SVU32_08570 [Candidatus Nanohaloarchaea archaeon]|nr:hypothetical protein [Candidatus Nanohaloarchaea archaeon]
MYLLIQPTDSLDTGARQRLQERIQERLQQHAVETDIQQTQSTYIIESPEERTAILASALTRTPGIQTVTPCIRTGIGPDQISNGIEQVLSDEPIRDITIEPPDSKLEGQLKDRLEIVGNGEHVHIRILDHAFLSTRQLDGIGGTPIDRSKITVTPLRDRLDVYAGYLLMQQGHSITPVHIDSSTDRVQEGLETLQAYDPAAKLTVIDADTWENGIEQAVSSFGAEYVCLGDLPSDTRETDLDIDVPVKRPLPDLSEDEALERYWQITVPTASLTEERSSADNS